LIELGGPAGLKSSIAAGFNMRRCC
jgi:hypothetical protein